ncbi:protein kinase domain-containing protein [Novipirellula artificiosorum]|uniref:Serine/threonine-protein kinase PknB n=1 Tax=Novipirellula artificiosorum TaxID=2528016 RepID=A0A5C6DV35_9BACT|nr:protein kinase [Novipirellula artificiosorum]TWU39301.1 Serine/threonine-protein kinase PknB [Novipirellula artificiosorum]
MATTRLKKDEIFNAAAEIDDLEKRAAYIDQACGEDVELRTEVEGLLRYDDTKDSFLDWSAPGLGLHNDQAISEQVGGRIGPYTLRKLLGEGGMGVVFLAEQEQPIRRQVALKVIKPGMDTKNVIARFEVERQALAMMDHPNIAHVLDVGTTEFGRPYFVMDLVPGVAVTDYCDRHKLSTPERLKLFVSICQAVQHAHQKGIIHRDIKPSNVLVTLNEDLPVAKIIDFGLAKAINQRLSDVTANTQVSQIVGTPKYMSPEQADLSSTDIDTRSDVYSLGVLLYELLTGTTPFSQQQLDDAGFIEMRRIIREQEPTRPSNQVSTFGAQELSTIADERGEDPSHLCHILRSELDWIAMKALEKDRDRRYESASAFAADVQRYLAGEAVEACPPSTTYRLKKFARRNRVAILTASLIACSMLIGTGVSVRQASRAIEAEGMASANLVQARKDRADALDAWAIAKKLEQVAKQQRNAALLNQYYSEIVSGQIDQQQGETERLEQKLIRHLPFLDQEDRRGWEWYYLFSLCHPETRTFFYYPSGGESNATWSPDGKYIAIAGMVVSAETGECFRSLVPSRLIRMRGCWSPDSQMYAWGTCSDDSCIYIWNRQSDELTELRGHTSSVWCVNWSPDSKQLASGGMDKEVWIWDVAAGAPIKKFEAVDFVSDLAWSPDGEMLAASTKWHDVKVWNPKTGELVAYLEDLGERGVGYRVQLSWHPESNQLAVSTTEGWFLVRRSDWTVIRREDREQARGYAVAWRPDGRKIAVANSGFMSILNPADDKAAPALYGPMGSVSSVAWSPDSQQLVTADDDGYLMTWDLNLPFQPPVLSTGNPIQLLSWLPDSETIVAVDAIEHSTSFWGATDGSRRKVEPALADGLTHWGPDRRLVACLPKDNRKDIRILDGTTGAVHSIWEQDSDDRVQGVAWSRDGTKLAIRIGIGARTSVELWDVDHEKRISIWRHAGVPSHRDISNAMAWCPDGTRIAIPALGQEGDDGGPAYRPHVYIVDVSRGVTILKHMLAAQRGPIVTSLAWNPDSQTFIAGTDRGTVEAVDVDSGLTRYSNRLSDTPVRFLAWSPDGRRIVSASEDGMVKVCAAGNGQDLLRFQLDDGVGQVIWSPDGKRLAAATDSGEIHVWDATKAYEYSEQGSKRGELAWAYYRSPRQTSDADEEARLRKVLKLAPDSLSFWQLRGHASAKIGDFERASQEFAKAIGPGLRRSFHAAMWYGQSLLGAGKPQAYRRHCDALLKAFANTEVPSSGMHVAWLCVLIENSQLDSETVLRLARAELNGVGGYQSKLCLGAAFYRNEQFKAAADMLTEVADQIESSSDPNQHGNLACSLYFLAMARQRLGHVYQARQVLADATEIKQKIPATSSWTKRVELKVLDQEARALIHAAGEIRSTDMPDLQTEEPKYVP